MDQDFRVCASCGRPLHPGDEFVVAEPLLRMRRIGDVEAIVAGSPQSFHADHVPGGSTWRVLTA